MQMIGNNIREKRVRLRRSFARATSKNSVPVTDGVSLESWNAIFDSLSNPKYQAKSNKCKVAADERTRSKGFTHKLGRRGVNGLVNVFMEEFQRQPTDEEVSFAKQNGIPAAVDHVRHGNVGVQFQEAVEVPQPVKSKSKCKASKQKHRPTSDDEDSEDGLESGEGEDDASGGSSDSDSDSEGASGSEGSGEERRYEFKRGVGIRD